MTGLHFQCSSHCIVLSYHLLIWPGPVLDIGEKDFSVNITMWALLGEPKAGNLPWRSRRDLGGLHSGGDMQDEP